MPGIITKPSGHAANNDTTMQPIAHQKWPSTPSQITETTAATVPASPLQPRPRQRATPPARAYVPPPDSVSRYAQFSLEPDHGYYQGADLVHRVALRVHSYDRKSNRVLGLRSPPMCGGRCGTRRCTSLVSVRRRAVAPDADVLGRGSSGRSVLPSRRSGRAAEQNRGILDRRFGRVFSTVLGRSDLDRTTVPEHPLPRIMVRRAVARTVKDFGPGLPRHRIDLPHDVVRHAVHGLDFGCEP